MTNHPADHGHAVEVDVVVVGAGLAGLVATAMLAAAGVRVLCLEARDRVGGRALTLDTDHGLVDLGATWWWPGEQHIEQLVRQLEAATFPQHLDGDALLDTADAVQRVRGNPIDVPAYRFGDGAASLPARLADQLPASAALRLGSPVVAIESTSEGVTVAALDQVRDEPFEVRATDVVVAVPPAVAVSSIRFTPALDPATVAAAAAMPVWMSEMVKAVAVYETPFWRAGGFAGAAISYRGPFREFHDMSGRGGVPAALFGFAPAPVFAAADDEAISEAFRDQLVRLYGAPAAQPVAVHVKNWSTDPWTAPGTSPAPSAAIFGHPAFAGADRSRRLVWAATETALQHAGHLSGAIESGARAAHTLLTDTTPA
jgi:monoamine oxidase